MVQLLCCGSEWNHEFTQPWNRDLSTFAGIYMVTELASVEVDIFICFLSPGGNQDSEGSMADPEHDEFPQSFLLRSLSTLGSSPTL